MYEIERKLPGVQIKKFKYRDNKFIISKCSRLQKGWLNFPLQLYCDFDSDIICWLCINWIFCFEKPFKHRPIQYFTKVAEGFKHWIKCWKYIHCIKLPVVFHSSFLQIMECLVVYLPAAWLCSCALQGADRASWGVSPPLIYLHSPVPGAALCSLLDKNLCWSLNPQLQGCSGTANIPCTHQPADTRQESKEFAHSIVINNGSILFMFFVNCQCHSINKLHSSV